MSADVRPGYKRTEIGQIPEDWFVTTLGKSFGKITTGKLDANAMSATGEYPFYTCAKEVYRIGEYAFDCDALLISGNGANVGYVHHYHGKFNAYQRTYVLFEAKYDIRYLKIYTEENLRERLRVEVNAGNTPYIVKSTLADMLIGLPKSRAEQKVIACTLDEIDSLITSLDQLIAKKRDIQQATMQQLLTGQRRLPGFSREWEVKWLGEVAPLKRGFDLPNAELRDGLYPVVYSNGVVNHHDKYQAQAPGVITGRSGTIGKLTFIEHGHYWPHNTTLWVTSFKSNDPKFVFYLFKHIGFERFSSGSGVPTLNRNDAHAFETLIPPAKAEQTAIATILSDMDTEIAALEARRDKTRQLKQGMMQELLTGKTRLL